MRVTCSALLVAVACAFAPAPQTAINRGSPLRMKKPSPATDAGPLPGLSENNYAVLAGVAATGLLAPALLFAPALLPAPAPPAKGKTSAKVPAPKGPDFSLAGRLGREKPGPLGAGAFADVLPLAAGAGAGSSVGAKSSAGARRPVAATPASTA